MAASDPAARCARLVRIYPSMTGETHALRGVDAVFERRTMTAVTGPSGSGKSSLLSVLALRERQSGGEPVGRRSGHGGRRRPGPAAAAPAHRGLGRAAADARAVRAPAGPRAGRAGGRAARARRRRCPRRRRACSSGCGSPTAAAPWCASLSGGEQQRLAVACAVVGDPVLVVADEPTAELDDESSSLVLGELRRLTDRGAAVVMSSHDHRAVGAADREPAPAPRRAVERGRRGRGRHGHHRLHRAAAGAAAGAHPLPRRPGPARRRGRRRPARAARPARGSDQCLSRCSTSSTSPTALPPTPRPCCTTSR
nr:ATP-binding cassette domain-containing protein [Angustibacter aerolatus]